MLGGQFKANDIGYQGKTWRFQSHNIVHILPVTLGAHSFIKYSIDSFNICFLSPEGKWRKISLQELSTASIHWPSLTFETKVLSWHCLKGLENISVGQLPVVTKNWLESI